MSNDEDRAVREAANFARHLNDQYSDTLLLVARALGGRPAAGSARISALTSSDVTLETDDGSGAGPVSLPLPGESQEPLRPRFRRLVEDARRAAPDEPLTGLERLFDGRGDGTGTGHGTQR